MISPVWYKSADTYGEPRDGAGPLNPRHTPPPPETPLSSDDLAHLRRLVARWGLLADLCFSDLLLYQRAPGEQVRVRAQVRPTTAPTIYPEDQLGAMSTMRDRGHIAEAFGSGRRVSGTRHDPVLGRVSVEAIPVRREGRTLAVISREHGRKSGREHGDLERRYMDVFDRFAIMIQSGTFPFPASADAVLSGGPRVGDGAVILDAAGAIQYVSPNAVSALHRSGLAAPTKGQTLPEIGLDQLATRVAFRSGLPTLEETRVGGLTIEVRCIPLIESAQVTGAFVMIQDVTELRSRDRLIMSKDATIREIHHRVKNNLQTISSLLRLQGRRLTEPSARLAIEESVQRIRSIAVVHETLSREHGDEVPFAEIAADIARMLDDISGAQITVRLEGDAGRVPSAVATSLAVVVNELIQNAVDHAFASPEAESASDSASREHVDSEAGAPDAERNTVLVRLQRGRDELCITVEDNGMGIHHSLGFAPKEPAGAGDTSTKRSGLGMSIVNSLVTSELSGTLATEVAHPGAARPGTRVTILIPVSDPDSINIASAMERTGELPVYGPH